MMMMMTHDGQFIGSLTSLLNEPKRTQLVVFLLRRVLSFFSQLAKEIPLYSLFVSSCIIVYQNGGIVKDPMKSISFVPKTIQEVGWGGWDVSCRGGVCHVGVGWVM